MIKTFFKHCIYEICIHQFFKNIKANIIDVTKSHGMSLVHGQKIRIGDHFLSLCVRYPNLDRTMYFDGRIDFIDEDTIAMGISGNRYSHTTYNNNGNRQIIKGSKFHDEIIFVQNITMINIYNG